ncbi:adenylate kinase [Paractinoplanes tereljensis]|uniref:Adenylate kinase n=2 Tax=Paractinoplanes tereljensis TaxID=571912 RepID=A0A919NRD2_9ACTN|nr:adenylate kinase [Actinoplanes tereljensis]
MSGAGKTTAAGRLADVLGLPFHEMDALAIGPGWATPPTFVADVERIVREPGWIFDSWGPPDVRDTMWAAADTVVWLDYPRRVVLPRLLRRSLSRSWHREKIFGGNVELWRDWLSPVHPFWHAVTNFAARRAYLAERTARETHLRTVHLRTPAEFDTWLALVVGDGA